jgi:hypothetical protein
MFGSILQTTCRWLLVASIELTMIIIRPSNGNGSLRLAWSVAVMIKPSGSAVRNSAYAKEMTKM